MIRVERVNAGRSSYCKFRAISEDMFWSLYMIALAQKFIRAIKIKQRFSKASMTSEAVGN